MTVNVNEYKTDEVFADLLNESILGDDSQEGKVVNGVVIAIDGNEAIIDVGLKSESRVPLEEFAIDSERSAPKVGEHYEVFIESTENALGTTVVSREKAIRETAWEKLEAACTEGSNVDGVIFGRVKGGFTVDIDGVVAFLPGSQVDIRPIKDISPLMNIKQPFQILKMDRKQGNIVVSRRAIMEESRAESRNEMLSQISEGMELEGVVKNITDYGAFIDLGSLDGLVHVTDISWSRISHPSEKLNVGQTVKVKVIKFDQDSKRISLGIKQLTENPWEGIGDRFPVGEKAKGVITNITDYGAFVELETGIEGLVHVSEFSWGKGNVNPRKMVSAGDEVEIMVLDIDASKHRISLGLKQCEDNPWSDFESKYNIGDVIEGKVKKILEFGVFIEIEEEIDGLVHLSDVAWEGNFVEKLKEFNKDDVVKAKILSIEPTKERVSLGIKQLEESPTQAATKDLVKNAIVTCEVSAVKDDGIEVTINQVLKSYIRRSDLARDKVEQRPDRFAVGDKIDAKIISIDKFGNTINLSVKALEIDEQKKAIAEFGSADSGASLGDILGAALNQNND